MEIEMRTFTIITRPEGENLPTELALLNAPVTAAEPSAPGEYVGKTEGVVLNEEGAIVAFIVQLAERLVPQGRLRTLIPTTAVKIQGSTLHVAWTEDQLLAQPRLDENFRAHNRVDGGAPVESQWMPARANVVPPGSGVNTELAAKEGVAGGAIGAAVGAVAGMIAGGPVAAAAFGIFFAAGGSLAGLISGASQETAPEAAELRLEDDASDNATSNDPRLAALSSRLCDPALLDATGLQSFRFIPLTSTKEAA
jgi:hypothetical protein